MGGVGGGETGRRPYPTVSFVCDTIDHPPHHAAPARVRRQR